MTGLASRSALLQDRQQWRRLRTKLDAAVVAERWEAVKVIGARLREPAREGVVLHAARARHR